MSLSVSLCHSFGGFTLDVTFEAPAGITVLFGRSGSGKTSIVNAVAGLLRPAQGHIAVGDRLLSDTRSAVWLPPHKRRLGYVFQEARLFPHLSVRHNLSYGRRFAPQERRRDDISDVVDMLGLGALLDRRPGALSGGERQRVAIGRALLSEPDCLLADEPLAALDAHRKADILPYFERLRDEAGVPILYVSHSAGEVARLATTVVALENGRIARQGPATEVLSDPEVTPLGVRAAGSVIEGRVLRHHADGLSELEAGRLTLLLPQVDKAPGSPVRVHIEAHDVIIATQRPDGLSALNIWPAEVRAIRFGEGPGAMIQLAAGDNLLLCRLTRRSAEALGLTPGKQVYAVLKAVTLARPGS